MLERVNRNKKTILILVLVLCALAFVTYERLSPKGFFAGLQNDLKTIEPNSASAYTDLGGNPIDLKDFKGKPLIINAWASWIPFSQTELPLLGKIAEKYKDKVTLLAINRMESVGVIQSYLSIYPIPQTVRVVVDPADTFYKAVDGYAMPETVFYNSNGVLVAHKRGVLTEEELEGYIQSIIDN
jgi:thiol-disulfide isomerase/thioredoxin